MNLNDVDEAFFRPLRREAFSKLDSASQSLIPDSDRYYVYASKQAYAKLLLNLFLDKNVSTEFVATVEIQL